MRYVFHPEALTEYAEAAQYYAEQRIEGAQAFIDSIEDAVYRIRESPTRYNPIVIYPCDKGGYVAEIPALKGCLAQGETLPEALEELETVTKLWIETAEKYGQLLPDVDNAIQKVKALSHGGSH